MTNYQNLSNNIAKAMLFDVALELGLSGLDTTKDALISILTTSFTAYTLRDIARIDYQHQWVGGAIAGAIKYFLKGNKPLLGAFNNFAYEFSRDTVEPYIGDNLPVAIIEGLDTAISKTYNAYKNNTSVEEAALAGTDGLLRGIGVGACLIGVATGYDKLASLTSSLPAYAVYSISGASLIFSGYKLGTSIGDYVYNSFADIQHDYNPYQLTPKEICEYQHA